MKNTKDGFLFTHAEAVRMIDCAYVLMRQDPKNKVAKALFKMLDSPSYLNLPEANQDAWTVEIEGVRFAKTGS